jgi:uncharacterized damage-inducible protein DinB
MTEIELIVVQLEQAFRKRSWHGTNLSGAIRGIKHEEAAWRPAPDRHNIWELIVHCAYWKYSVYRRFAGGKLSFELKGSNWFVRPEEPSDAELRADVTLLKNYHANLIEAVSRFPSKKLGEIPTGSSTTYRDLIIGTAAHDLYHAGQIQLLKRLRKS